MNRKAGLAIIAASFLAAAGIAGDVDSAGPWTTRATAKATSVGPKHSTMNTEATVSAKIVNADRLQVRVRRTGGLSVEPFTVIAELHCANRPRVDQIVKKWDGGADRPLEVAIQMTAPVVDTPCVLLAKAITLPGVGVEMDVRTRKL